MRVIWILFLVLWPRGVLNWGKKSWTAGFSGWLVHVLDVSMFILLMLLLLMVCVRENSTHSPIQSNIQSDRQTARHTHTHTNHNFNHTNTSTHLHSLHYTRTHTHSPFTHSDSFAHTIIRTANWLNQNMRPQKKGTFETHIAYIRTRTHKSNRIIRSVRRQVYLK